MTAVADVSSRDPVLAIEHVIRREGIDPPVSGNARITKDYRNVELVALGISAYFLNRTPVECDGDYLEFRLFPPAALAAQILHQGAKK